jgi:hypothetical protein
MSMYKILYTLLLLTLIISCKKHTHKPNQKTLEELLTAGNWLLVAYGYDDSNNGIIDPNENMINDCQKDNTTEYKRDGSGETLENELVCFADSVYPFQWKFIDNEKAIEIEAQRLDIKKLTETELEFKIQIPYLTSPLYSRYRKQ